MKEMVGVGLWRGGVGGGGGVVGQGVAIDGDMQCLCVEHARRMQVGRGL